MSEDDTKKETSAETIPPGLSPEKALALSREKITRHLLRHHPQTAAEILDTLPVEDQARLVLEYSGRDRLELILLSSQAQTLVQALPPAELWLTIKQIGEEDCLELIRMAHPSQLQHFFDLEWWHQAALDPLAVAYWLMLMTEAGEEVVVNWFRQADEELLVSAFAKFFKVYKADPENEGAEPFRSLQNLWTLDNVYYLHFPEPGTAPVIERALSLIRAEEPMKYYGLLEAVDNLLLTEQEDAAFHFRSARLMDHGFVDFEEALEIYAPLSDHELQKLIKETEAALVKPPPGTLPPSFPLLLCDPPPLLGQALARLEDPEVKEEFKLGVATLVNRVLVADTMDLSRLESVSSALNKAYTFMELGLIRASAGNLELATSLLQTQHPFIFFRAGYTKLLNLARRAHRWKQENENPDLALELLGEDGLILKGLLLHRPQFYGGADKEGAPLYREFLSGQEVNRAELALQRAEFSDRFFREVIPVSWAELALLKEYVAGVSLTWEVVLLVAISHYLRGKNFSLHPLLQEEALSALSLLLTEEKPRRVREEAAKQLEELLTSKIQRLATTTEQDLALGHQLLHRSLDLLAQEARDLDLTALDPRYFHALVLAPEK